MFVTFEQCANIYQNSGHTNKTAIQVLNGFYVATTTTTDAAQLKQFELNIKKTHTPYKVNNLSSSAIKSIPNKCLNIVGEKKRNQFYQATTNG